MREFGCGLGFFDEMRRIDAAITPWKLDRYCALQLLVAGQIDDAEGALS